MKKEVKKHPAVIAYEKMWQRIVDNQDDASLMPQGSGDVVGRARHEQAMHEMGIQYPVNPVEYFQWCEDIGVIATARRLTKKYNRMMKTKREECLLK